MQRVLRRISVAVVASVLAAIAVVPALGAQGTGSIEGRVTAANTARPLPEVQVSIPGTVLGARTDENGRFRIPNVPAGAHRIRAQRIGYNSTVTSVTVTAGQAATADFALREAALSLEAVVVTGTAAEARQKEVGNAIASIDAKAIEAAPVRNAQDILAGRSPGVTVLQNSGQPGASGTIRLRGTNSITQGNNPVIYVDGVRIYSENGRVTPSARQSTSAFNDIKPEDIDRIEVVKGAAATTLYGTEASSGVIQIFTKRGTSGRPQWTLELGTGANFQGHVGPRSDPTGLFVNHCRSITGGELVDAFGVPFVDPTCPSRGSWLRTGLAQRYSAAVRGGGEALTYFVSTNYNSDEGVIATSRSQDGGLRGNFSFTPGKNLMFAVNTFYNKKIIRWVPDGNLANGFLLNVARGPSNNFKGGKGECAGITMTCVTNAYILEQKVSNDADHFISGVTLSWSPTPALTNRFNVGWDYNASNNRSLRPFGFLGTNPNGDIISPNWGHTKLSLDYAGSLQSRMSFLRGLASTFSWGGQVFDDRERYTSVQGFDFAGPGEPTLGSAARVSLNQDSRPRVVNAGFFLQEMLGWRDRAFLTLGLRVDGNSAFGQDFGLQEYPKVSASYVISDEAFWPKQFLPTLKLRAALGESGKAPGAFDAVATWDPVAGDEGKPAVTVAQKGNPKLGPERTRELELGFDLGALDNRISLELTAFRARTYGALIGVTYPPSEGFSQSQLENVGTLENKGIEAQLTAGIFRSEAIDWQTRVSYTGLKSKAIDLGEVAGEPRQVPTGNGSWVRRGYAVPTLFGAVIKNPDEFANPVVVLDSAIGPVYPTRIVSVGTTLSLRNRLTFDVLGEHQGGSHLGNWIGYQNALRNVWRPCYAVQKKLRQALGPDGVANTADDVPAAIADVTARDRGRCAIDRTVQNSDFWISPIDYFKLRSVSVTYQLPQRLFAGGRSATLTIAGRNLFKSTKYDGADPESYDAQDAGNNIGRREYYQLPPYKTVIVTLRTIF